jgi:hypothetical protein
MTTEFRVIFTATFATTAERDKIYNWIKGKATDLALAAKVKRADITKDEYSVPDVGTASEKII